VYGILKKVRNNRKKCENKVAEKQLMETLIISTTSCIIDIMKHKKRNEQSNASFSSPASLPSLLNYRKIIRI